MLRPQTPPEQRPRRRPGRRPDQPSDQRSGRARPLAAIVIAVVVGTAACVDTSIGSLDDGDPERGEQLFAVNCVACHGRQGQGTTAGPPLVHELYAPEEFSDLQIAESIRHGVAQRHWDFGRMPRFGALDDDDLADLVAHVRVLQGATSR